MFRTVFSRMLCTYLIIVLISMLLLGLWVGQKFRVQYEQERVDAMCREAEEVNTIIAEKYYYKDKRSVAMNELTVIARKYNAYIWVIDLPGNLLYINDPERESEWSRPENNEHIQACMEDVLAGNIIKTTGSFDEAFGNEPVMTIGRPLIVHDEIAGSIFMHTMMGDIEASVKGIYESLFSSALMAIMLAVILVPLTARNFTKPLVQMNQVAKSYAKGDFSSRVEVKSNDEIGQLAGSFNAMARDLKGLDDMRKSFVANASHEMKAPLASMRGFLQAVLDGTIPPEEQEEYLGVVLDETKRLSSLVTDLLDLSTIESDTLQLNPTRFDINEKIRRILIMFETRIDEKNLQIEADFKQDQCFVQADEDKISQVLRNLIDNAIKFTPPGGAITVWVYSSKKHAYVAVRDTGVGIPQEDLPLIWGRFYKVEKAHTPGGGGTGLGLSIIKKLVELHHCEIWCTSTPGKGANFCFTLPLAPVVNPTKPSKGKASNQSAG